MKQRGNASVASAVRNALKQEKIRYDATENQKFTEFRHKNDQQESAHSFPRTLANKTFFTPHLSKVHKPLANDHIIRQYAVIFSMNGEPTVSITPYNPSQQSATNSSQSSAIPPGQPENVLKRVHQLEKAGFRFYGTNKDILVFERLYNPKQTGRHWAKRSAIVITTSVALLTITLFAGEHLL